MTAPGRPTEFDELFDRVFPASVRVAARIVGSDDAEDVAVEAFARALQHWRTVLKAPNRDAWVLRVTTNVALDSLRHERRRPIPAAILAQDVEEAAALRITLQEAMRRLPRRQAQVLSLRFLAGLDESQVAAALGISLGSVKTHARRGLHSLRCRGELLDAG